MTITPTAPSITPCPVSWCPSAGRHEWNWLDHPSIEPDRNHTLSVLNHVSDTGEVAHLVAVECYETATGSETKVEIEGHPELLDRQEVDQMVDAIHRAADLAFGPSPVAEHQAELDAAAAELITRAGHPEDVNRLVAAAVRYRKAHGALVRRRGRRGDPMTANGRADHAGHGLPVLVHQARTGQR